MDNRLFGYSEFLEDVREHALGQVVYAPELRWVEKEPNDPTRFFDESHDCPFCSSSMTSASDTTEGGPFNYRYSYRAHDHILVCPSCGWWQWIQDFTTDLGNGIDERHEVFKRRRRYAIAKTFQVDDKDLPTQVLTKALQDDKTLLHRIHPTRLETLVQHVFAEHFQCEVKHVGRSSDGGIDLIVVQSDSPMLVQVKRRSSSEYVEGVDVVRDLIGAMFINSATSGIILSTARRFSSVATATVDRLLSDRRLREFKLIDYSSFCDMLDLSKDGGRPVWMDLLQIELDIRKTWK